MEKSFTIKSLYDKLDPQTIAMYLGMRTGMGHFKDWELWQIRKTDFVGKVTVYYLAQKDNLVICDETFTNILEYIDKSTEDSI